MLLKSLEKECIHFSSVYMDKDCNEEPYIRRVNEMWNTIPHYVRPDDYEKDLAIYIEELTRHRDQPAKVLLYTVSLWL